LTKIVSSNINVDNDLTINTANTTTVQSSNLRSGLANQNSTIPNPDITGKLEINTKKLNILADATSNVTTGSIKVGKTLRNKFNDYGKASTDFVNSNLTANDNNFVFNVTDEVNIAGKGVEDKNNYSQQREAYITALKEQLSGNSNSPIIN